MAAISTSLAIKSIIGDEPVTKTISGVNPEASFNDLDNFARKFNGLSKQSYVDSFKITKESVNENITAGD